MKHKFSILIIDDSKLINNSLTQSLSSRGFEVIQAFDVQSAKNILRDRSFDYALLDLELPDGAGEDVLPYLQIHEEIRVIVMTSDRDKQRREHLFTYGVVIDYITKERYFADMELSIVQLIERVSTNHNLSILVVDDSKFMRTQLRILLSKRGFNVYDAINGKDALLVLKKQQIDGAIIDLEMPVMDGNKLLGAIKRDKKNLLMPVMVVSGTTDPDKIARVIKNGASDFINKPYSTEELILRIDKMMEELKQQRKIKQHEARFEMYNQAIDKAAIFFKIDNDFTITYANDTLCKLLCDSGGLIEGMNFEEYLNGENSVTLDGLKDAMQEKKSFKDVFSFKNSSSHHVSLNLTFTPLLNEKNEIDEILVIGFDVTLLEQKESDLKEKIEYEVHKNWEQNKMLIQQSKMASMGEMIGHIGHQWRQPLSSLGIMFQKLDLAYRKEKLNEQLMTSSTQKAIRIIEQMSKTIDDFRDFFKSDKKLYLTTITDVLDQANSVIEATLLKHNITLNRHIKNNIEFKCYKNELSQVILNIIVNAKDAILLNEVQNGEISITVQSDTKYINIIIDDNAGGIPEDILEKVFEPYFTTKEKSNGTGIGLYMSKTIIEEHMQGKLELSNTLSGASFKIKLPLR
ncbi:response regulator [Sulfurimonas sp. SAG-AH-194-L11]|nr:response regulator [Sulfurimonas sp. SAG-AH-194-L11]MDF1876640.1 response regulator [Sulfurimonas sp. SAG-AH-194-L11]